MNAQEADKAAALELATAGRDLSKRKKSLVHDLAFYWYCDRGCQAETLRRLKTSPQTLDSLLVSGVLKDYADLYFGETKTLEHRSGNRSTRGRF